MLDALLPSRAPAAAARLSELLGIYPDGPSYLQRQHATAAPTSGDTAAAGQWTLHTLRLLAACAHGRSLTAVARLQALYPLRLLLPALADGQNSLVLRRALLAVLLHVHVDSDRQAISASPRDDLRAIATRSAHDLHNDCT